MPRTARVIAPALPHHVTARGNHGLDIFEDNLDRDVYLGLLRTQSLRQGVSIQAYCLMTNHVHLVLTPKTAKGLSGMMRSLQRGYSEYFNHRKIRGGHLWSDRYYSCVLDEEHLWAAVRYVEMNPVHAGMIDRPEAYRWSSAAGHCGLKADELLDAAFPEPGVVPNWQNWLVMDNQEQEERIRLATERCRVAGNEGFIQRLGKKLKRDLKLRPQGRPPKKKE